MNTKQVTACVVDSGLFCDLAVRLSREFGHVYYCVQRRADFPEIATDLVGFGVEGIERIDFDDIWGDVFDKIDLFIFPDIGYGEMQKRLEKMGKLVWGSRNGEDLEGDREGTKKAMQHLGLPVGKYEEVKGMKALRKYLANHKDVYVKVSKFRGTFESFKSRDLKSIEPKLNEIEYKLGPFGELVTFCVEDDLPDCVELGVDAYTVDGKFPNSILSGIEIKDRAYVGVFKGYREFPEPLIRVNDALSPLMAKMNYRGFWSSEVRIGADHVPYLIDATARAGSPPSELYSEFYLNLGEIIYEGAQGKMVEPKPIAKYGAQVILDSAWADKNWLPIDFPQEYRRWVKLREHVKINGQYYSSPQGIGLTQVGAVIGIGDSMKAAFEMAKTIADDVKGYSVSIPLEAFEEAEAEIAKAKKLGLSMF